MGVLLGPQQLSVPAGLREYGPFSVAAKTTSITAKMSRENWPASGVDLDILVSFDGGQNYESPGPTHIDQWVARPPKHTDVLAEPASISRGWNEATRPATHVKARSNAPSSFLSTVTVESALAP